MFHEIIQNTLYNLQKTYLRPRSTLGSCVVKINFLNLQLKQQKIKNWKSFKFLIEKQTIITSHIILNFSIFSIKINSFLFIVTFSIFSGFTMYTTCVIWLAFVPLYFGTANHVPLRITSMSVTISLSASVTVACLFSPKVSKTLFILSFDPLSSFMLSF